MNRIAPVSGPEEFFGLFGPLFVAPDAHEPTAKILSLARGH
jgi:hypothetical protein